jgi:two-component system sensor histidine kinase CpxA
VTAERRLLQDVSHELRSPLARLSFAAELMKGADDPEAAASRMKREIARLSRLVAALLEVNSAEGDPSSRKTQRFLLTDLVREIVEDCAFEAEAHQVRIESMLDSAAIVEGDPELIRRAVENVVRNAIRFAPHDSAVMVRMADCPGNVVISIRDCGPGAPPELLSRIFDPFFRVDESRDGATGGAGLGLSIARRAVLLHHGEIIAENASPGLRVRTTIPRVEV